MWKTKQDMTIMKSPDGPIARAPSNREYMQAMAERRKLMEKMARQKLSDRQREKRKSRKGFKPTRLPAFDKPGVDIENLRP
jgi:hypothetical protein